jgi:putative DNA primase/helicase
MGGMESPETAATRQRLQDLRSLPDTDAGNAEAFELLYGNRFRYDHSKGKWFVWSGRYWAEDKDKEADRTALLTARARRFAAALITDPDAAKKRIKWAMDSEAVWRREAMLKSASSIRFLASLTSDFDCNPMLLTVGNGTLNLKSGHLGKTRPEDLITRASNIDFNPSARCPRWRGFLEEVFANDRELIDFIQRAVGYSLTGDTREQCLFVLYGSGANGKSTFLETIRRLLDGHVVTTPFSTFMLHVNQNGPRNDLAALQGARLVLASEVGQQARFDESVVKRVTGQDIISCRFLYGEFFEYKPQFKIWLATNYKPVIRGNDNAIWRRIRLVPFSQQFDGNNADRLLLDKLEAELAGILAWAVEGCLAWQKRGLGKAVAVESATQEYRRESDQFGRFFGERCVRGKQSQTQGKALYEAYVEWCVRTSEKPASNPVFAAALAERGIAKKRSRKGVVYQGVELAPLPAEKGQ